MLSTTIVAFNTNQPMLFMCRPTCSAPLVRPVLLWLFLSLFVLMPSFASCPPWSHALIIPWRCTINTQLTTTGKVEVRWMKGR